ncbi:MAG: ATP-binding protein [Flavobacterium sp.]
MAKINFRRNTSLIAKVALTVALLLVSYVSFVFFQQMQNLEKSVSAMSESSKRLMEYEQVLSILSVNEASMRSFIITKDSSYITKRFYKKEAVLPFLKQIEKTDFDQDYTLTKDSLTLLIDLRFKIFEEALIASKDITKSDNPQLAKVLRDGDYISDQLREYVRASVNSEATNLKLFKINHHFELQTSIVTTFMIVTLALFIILVSINQINSDVKKLKKVNSELSFLNYTFNKAEKFAGISHWKYNVEQQKFSFSDNFWSSVEGFESTIENGISQVLKRVHPEDKSKVIATYSESFSQLLPTSIIFRIFSGVDELRYIKAVGSYVENDEGEHIKIAVNYDITEQYSANIAMEKVNHNLQTINDELESFNNIVSHDMQEPLRKIQMFISRIEEDELQKLSPKAQGYFDRISFAANRMQNLMIDLVNYSQSVKGEKIFEKVHLKSVVQRVVEMLPLEMEEHKVKIEIDDLPEIIGLPFQLQQLFVNLISNSIKFGKEDSLNIIHIYVEEIPEGEVKDSIEFSKEEFYKIIVSDTGVGFDQQFATKIFKLFSILKKNSQHKGTGIGLAICKRVMDNHNGFIFAKGEINKGSKFILYFPKNLIQNKQIELKQDI